MRGRRSLTRSKAIGAAFAVGTPVSLAVAALLVTVDIGLAQKVHSERVRASRTVVPNERPIGQKFEDGLEWVAPEDEQIVLVLFSLTDSGSIGDLQFWRDVATRSREVAPDTQFVGLCLAGRTCEPLSEPERNLTLLKLMSPAITHVLLTSASKGSAFVYRGSSVRRVTVVERDGHDTQAYARRIAALSTHQVGSSAP